jgi:hypothetical protein
MKGMKALMVLFDSELKEELFMLMNLSEIVNYSHFLGLHGSGNQGKKQGSVTWPGTNEIILIIANDEELDRFKSNVQDYKKNKNEPTGLLFFHWELTEVIV